MMYALAEVVKNTNTAVEKTNNYKKVEGGIFPPSFAIRKNYKRKDFIYENIIYSIRKF